MKHRVFHIISRLDVGGAERVAISIAQSPSPDFEYHIVELIRANTAFTQQIIEELCAKGIRIHRSPIPVFIHWHYLFERIIALLFPLRFLLLWLRWRPDIVHTHTEMPDVAIFSSLSIMPWIRCRVVRTIHNTVLWTGMNILAFGVERFMQKHRANIAISPAVQKCYTKRFGTVPPIIYNGVSPIDQVPYKHIQANKCNILFAGRFEKQKGIDILVKIIKMTSHDQRYHFHVFGSGSMQPIIDNELHLLPNVTVMPPIHTLSQHLASFDYLIMPSIHEGLSILSLEASANGLPVLANDCDGLIDTLPPQWPLLVHNNDMNEWQHLFCDILPKTDNGRLSQQASDYVNSHFSITAMQKEHEQFYTEQLCTKH